MRYKVVTITKICLVFYGSPRRTNIVFSDLFVSSNSSSRSRSRSSVKWTGRQGSFASVGGRSAHHWFMTRRLPLRTLQLSLSLFLAVYHRPYCQGDPVVSSLGASAKPTLRSTIRLCPPPTYSSLKPVLERFYGAVFAHSSLIIGAEPPDVSWAARYRRVECLPQVL